MAVRVAKEDLVLGFFVVFAIIYPFFIAFLVWYEDYKKEKEVRESLEPFILLVGGKVKCDTKLGFSVEESILEEAKKLCEENKSKNLTLQKERVEIEEDTAKLYAVYKEDVKSIKLSVSYNIKDKKIEDFSYEEGN